MRFLNFSFIAALALLILSACDDGKTGGNPVDNKPIDSTVFHPLMPLKVGNSWDYQVTEYSPDGSQNGIPYSYQKKIDRDSVINGVKTFLIPIGEGDNLAGYVNKEDGLYVWSSEDSWNRTHNRIVKYPIVKGELYHITLDPVHPQGASYTVLVEETSIDVTVPAGTFKCVKIKRTNDEHGAWDTYYYAKNIGLIKVESMDFEEEGSPYYLFSKTELINKNF